MKKESKSEEVVKKVDIADAIKSSLLKEKWNLCLSNCEIRNYENPGFLDKIKFFLKPKWTIEVVKNNENSDVVGFYLTKMLFSKYVRITLFKKDYYGNVSIKKYGRHIDANEDFFNLTAKSAKKLWNILTFDLKINKFSVKDREQDQSIINIVIK